MRTPDASKATIELPLSPSVAAVIGATPWKHVRKTAISVRVVVAAASFNARKTQALSPKEFIEALQGCQ